MLIKPSDVSHIRLGSSMSRNISKLHLGMYQEVCQERFRGHIVKAQNLSYHKQAP